MQWLANLLVNVESIYLSAGDGKHYWALAGCQIRLIDETLHLGGLILGTGNLSGPLNVEMYLDGSKIDLIDMGLDIIEDEGSRYLTASSIPGITKVLFMTKTEDDRPRVTIERTFRRHD